MKINRQFTQLSRITVKLSSQSHRRRGYQEMERFADELDLAQYQTDLMTMSAITAIRRQFEADAGRKDCRDCGAPIPPARLLHVPGAHRCRLCQERHERRSSQH
ncbi:MAG: TraR/DksA C4-type zinc finger protein [Lamprobacter sp.]|uniref:TraR/DksA C4-type zinc finger protein n=1 Tax=Lamprobacter sp. TaxID=3100796 RepID=UPI002B25EAED|nr:TraR/DksA C4-type zinc finger protein [Lamprobacter sp.]MEA3639059.1 TraR/DksA C4-type zinc finger protein [Lamprobacter sp.]